MKRKLLAALLACFMVLSVMPFTVFALSPTCELYGEEHTLDNCPNATFVETVAPSCGEWGYDLYKCPDCEATFAANFVDPASAHDWVAFKDAVAVTCLTDGSYAIVKCSICDQLGAIQDPEHPDVVTEIDALDDAAAIIVAAGAHDWDMLHPIVVSAGDCETTGKIKYGCLNCDAFSDAEDDTTTGLGHVWSIDFESIVEPADCKTDGKVTYVCEECGATKIVVVKTELDHDLTHVEAKDASCDADTQELVNGNIEYWQCNDCGKCFSDSAATTEITLASTVIAAAHTWASAPTIVAATCTEFGFKFLACKNCGVMSDYTVYPPANHDILAAADATSADDNVYYDDYQTNKTAILAFQASCEGGDLNWTCSLCSEAVVTPVAGIGHDLTSVSVEATCAAKAFTFKYCSNENCNFAAVSVVTDPDTANDVNIEIDGEPLQIDPASITFSGTVNADNHAWVLKEVVNAPTCTAKGVGVNYCPYCDIQEAGIELPALGHHLVAGTPVAPDCSSETDGYTTYSCDRAGCTYSVDKDIVKFAHDFEGNDRVDIPGKCGPDAAARKGQYTLLCNECGNDIAFFDTALDYANYGKKDMYEGEDEALEFHTFTAGTVDWSYRPGTCTLVGLGRVECTVCNQYILIHDTETGNGHVGAPAASPAATCEAPGTIAAYTCSVCLETVPAETLTALGHDYTPVAEVAATCLADGTAAHFTCANGCGKLFILNDDDEYEEVKADDLVIEALDHDYVTVQAAVPHTCTEDGTYAVCKCSRCNDLVAMQGTTPVAIADMEDALIVDASLGHNYVIEDDYTDDCVGFTYNHYVCEYCGDEYVDSYEDVTEGHDFQFDHTEAPTCVDQGYDVYLCANCSVEDDRNYVDALGHENAAGDELVDSCLNDVADRVCARCTLTIGNDHDWEYDATWAATCDKNGYDIYVCAVCGLKKVTNVVEKLDPDGEHTWEFDYVVEYPTETEEGIDAYYCTVCGATEERPVAPYKVLVFEITSDNAVVSEAGLADSSKVVYKVYLDLSDTESMDIWGLNYTVNFGYDVRVDNVTMNVNEEVYNSMYYLNFVKNASGYVTTNALNVVVSTANDAEDHVQNSTVDGKMLLCTIDAHIEQHTNNMNYYIANASVNADTAVDKDGNEIYIISDSVWDDLQTLMDVNADDYVDLADALCLYKIITGEADVDYDVTADLNKDGVIDLSDLTALYTYLINPDTYSDIVGYDF